MVRISGSSEGFGYVAFRSGSAKWYLRLFLVSGISERFKEVVFRSVLAECH